MSEYQEPTDWIDTALLDTDSVQISSSVWLEPQPNLEILFEHRPSGESFVIANEEVTSLIAALLHAQAQYDTVVKARRKFEQAIAAVIA